ncbi:MAG: 50S ribosomal protein L18e [Candidatus Burarchaeum sp.]|nr:50S ribosomal protein L18e [Candidatus Burarchaeum sp.]MDO8339391.1 50S ribosomal protein L18e [Candidatus Burarchaeum sp.]
MKRGTTNENLAALIVRLEKASKANKAPLWAALARRLSKAHRAMAEVDAMSLDKRVPQGSAAVVPGVVLGSGKAGYTGTVAALRFSASARASLAKAGAKPLTIEALLAANPKGTNVAIIV